MCVFMMKFTFEDGSNGYLAHHGVKGMKWGVRNSETLSRYDRLGSELASKDGYNLDSKKDGREYLALKKENEKATAKLERFFKKNPNFREDKKLDEKHFELYADWERTDGNIRDFTTSKLQKIDSMKDSYKKLRDADVDEPSKGPGIPGMKWGTGEDRSKETLFVSGSSKTQDKGSGYYRRNLPKGVRQELKSSMKSGDKIIVGDAPGIDRQVQDYLKKKRYKDVEVYGPDIQPRYKAGKDWVFNAVNDPKSKPGSKEWLAKKDVAMTNRATKGLAVILDQDGAQATRRNVERLGQQGKGVKVYELSSERRMSDGWTDPKYVKSLPH